MTEMAKRPDSKKDERLTPIRKDESELKAERIQGAAGEALPVLPPIPLPLSVLREPESTSESPRGTPKAA